MKHPEDRARAVVAEMLSNDNNKRKRTLNGEEKLCCIFIFCSAEGFNVDQSLGVRQELVLPTYLR